ncbi:DEAD/DEAH box helicase [Nakamurella sp.]|uniref:DEAD/DEAH box helicase n=1 Tax=Nakamurella sp. TaxID=1869182 RepID=UPI003B3B789A
MSLHAALLSDTLDTESIQTAPAEQPEPSVEPEPAPAEPSFADLGLPAELLRAVTGLGFRTPTAIQAAAIPALLGGRDITGIAQTGTGKTAAFGLPLLAAVDTTPGVQALVLCPTRELAVQVADAITSFATAMPDITVVPIYGGTGFLPQRAALKAGAQVVVGTPGRIIDHLERGTLDLSGLRFMVLDEADEMLRMGFAEDVDRILSDAPASRQTALFSATMPPPIRAIANQHMTDPMDIAVSRQSSTVDSVRQIYAVVPFRDKSDALARFLQVTEGDAAIVFVRTKEACDQVGADLVARGVTAAVMNGDVPQKEREKIIERLRDGRLDVLVATDVAARGLDVDRIDLVVNFDAPGEPEAYVHRIGRTGRAGRTGTALTFFTPREMSRLRAIERATRGTLEQIVPPTPDEVAAHRAAVVLRKAIARFDVGRLQHQNRLIRDLLAENDLTGEELAAALLALAAGDDGREPEPAPEPAAFDRDRKTKVRSAAGTTGDRPRSGAERGGRARAPFGRRYRVAVGHRDGVRPAGIVGAITGEGGVTGKDLGKIDIYDSYSTVEIGTELSPAALGRIANAKVSGRTLRIEPDRDDAQGRRPWAGQRDSHGPRRAGGAGPEHGHGGGRGYRAGR